MGINTGFMRVQDSHTPYPYVHETLSFNPPGVIFSREDPPVEDFHQATYLTCLVRVINQKHLLNCYE